MSDHRERLRSELLAAAEHLYGQGVPDTGHAEPPPKQPVSNGPPRRIIPALAAGLLLVLAVVGVAVARDGTPVGADTFDINEQDDVVTIRVIGEVSDPEEAAAELAAVGFDVDLVGVPTPPSLVGDIVGILAEDSTLEDMHFDDRRLESVSVPAGRRPHLQLEYGREAEPGENYVVTEPAPGCEEYSGRVLTDELVERLVNDFGPEIRWDEYGSAAQGATPDELIDAGAQVITITPGSPTLSVVLTIDGDPPPGMAC